MTVPIQDPIVSYTGNGIATQYTVPFRILVEADLTVLLDGDETALYTITGLGDDEATVIFNAAPSNGQSIIMYRSVALERQKDYQFNGDLRALTVNADFDRIWMALQDIASTSSRALHFPPTEIGRDGTLPEAAARAGNLLGFDASGTQTMFPIPPSVGAGDMKLDTFVAGVDFTPGTTTQLTLSRAPGSAANAFTYFDATPQLDGFTVDNYKVIFDAPIPVGVGTVFIKTGTTLSLNKPGTATITDESISGSSSLYDLIANNFRLMDARFSSTDDTARVQKALDYVGARGGGVVFVSDGVNLTMTRSVYFNYPNVKLLSGNRYANTFKAANNAIGIDAQAMFKILAANCGLVGIGIYGNVANNLSNVFGAVWSDGRDGSVIENCYIRNCIGDGITLYATSGAAPNSNFSIQGNLVQNMGWGGISVFYGKSGVIDRNHVISTGTTAIRTDGITGNLDAGVSWGVDITNNYVNRGTPPTQVRGGGLENGFMIAYGAGDAFISVQDNFCYDNRNAAEDGIGLGQDGIHNNVGCIVQGNVCVFAGLFGIDATNQSTVVDNIIMYSTQCGIKVGTDLGGNCTSCLIKDNLIYQPNNPTARFPTVQDTGILVATNLPGVYAGIRITGNKVIDERAGAARKTNYGLVISFMAGLIYSDNDFSDNDFTQVGLAGVFAAGTFGQETGWTYSNNKHPANVKPVTGAVLNVFGYEKVTVNQPSPTTVTNILGGFDGCDLSIQHADGNTTFLFNSNAFMYGNGNTNLTPAAGNWMKFERFNSVWAGYRTIQ
ncbi:hypothetical protein A9R05_06915 [Burkholderia sp. KK1]|nr:hypothetical protein A9R05_06915 [Burkholderia sp. KK1]